MLTEAPRHRRQTFGLTILLVSFVALGLTYAWITPLFESPDASSHLQVIHYFSEHRQLYPPTLPAQRIDTGAAMAASLRYHVPPLYYTPPLYHVLGALLTAWTPMDDLSARLIPNPAWELGWSPERNADPRNKNLFVHLPGETWQESSTVRTALTLRCFSIVLGALTVVCTYAIGTVLMPHYPALALSAAAWVAFNPQFIALSSSVTNDPLIIAVFALFMWLALRAMQDRARWSRWACLGMWVGVGLLTKQSALLLLPIGGLAILGQGDAGKLPPWRKILADGAAFGLAAVVTGGAWYGYNALSYGDPLGVAPHFSSQMPLVRFGPRELQAVFETYWAGFGWTLLSVPKWIYLLIGAGMWVALAGLLRGGLPGGNLRQLSTQARRGVALLVVAQAFNALSLIRWSLATGAPYGRLLFPTLPATAILLALGWDQWRERPVMRYSPILVLGLLGLFAAAVPWTTLWPAFRQPRLSKEVPQDIAELGISFSDVVLVGYQTNLPSDGALRPKSTLALDLYWRSQHATLPRYTVWLQLARQDITHRIADDNVWLGGTRYPSDFWRGGDLVRQTHHIQVPGSSPFGLYWLRLGLVDATGTRAVTVAGQDVVTLGPWRIRPHGIPRPAHPLRYQLGESIALRGYDVTYSDTLTLTLMWQAEAVPGKDYRVFVHWVDDTGAILTQHDGPPAQGRYPTPWWLPGDKIPDPHPLPIPTSSPDSAHLRIGMYDPVTGIRLPMHDEKGTPVAGDALPLHIDLQNPTP